MNKPIHEEFDLESLRRIWAYESAQREDPNTVALVASLLASDDPRVVKVTQQYDRGLVTWFEYECKIRELLA